MSKILRNCLVLICLIAELVDCGSDLCKNGAKIDAITFIDTKRMWFFTSGGHYWFTKEEDFPPKEPGKPLPGGFKRGEAAIYKNTLSACQNVQSSKPKPQEQEIHLLEMVGGENKILIYDTRTNKWVNKDSPTPYNKDRGLGQAKIDWTAPIDAALIYNRTNLVVIQGKRYSVVDISNVCTDPNAWGDGKQSRSTTELNVMSAIDATAAIDHKYFNLFQDQVFWKVEITAFKKSEGRLYTTKNMQQDTLTEFWKFQEDCILPSTAGKEAPATPPEEGPVGEVASPDTPQQETEAPPQPEPEPQPEPQPEPVEDQGGNESEQTSTEGSDESGFPWIIVVIIVIIIVLIAIVLIACLAMRKKKGSDTEGAQDVAPGASSTGSATGSRPGASKAKSSLGDSPSTMSVRSNTGLAAGSAKGGSKAGSKGGHSPKGAKGMSSSMGSSPSTMSVRSNAGLATSKTGSKK